MAAESWWCWPPSAWLSSGTACFLFFNAVVCAVVVLSSSWGRGGDATPSSTRRGRLTRSASSMVMERLRSMSTCIFSFHSAAEYDSIVTPPASQLYCYTSREGGEAVSEVELEPEPAVAVVESMPSPPAPSAPVAAAAEVCAAASTSGSLLEDDCAAVARRQAPEPASAALERPRKWKVAGIVERRRAYAENEEKAEVNARAERFIRQFREDLKLERLNSILNCGRAAPAR